MLVIGPISCAALEVAPRVGEEFAIDLLNRVSATWDVLPDSFPLIHKARLLERALIVTAHFGRIDHVNIFVTRIHKMLQTGNVENETDTIMDELIGHCFRGLRKLGMRDEIDKLLTKMTELILQGRNTNEMRKLDPRVSIGLAKVCALLHVAGGWYYFGRDHQAEPIMQTVHRLLLSDDEIWVMANGFTKVLEKTKLACIYATTLALVPPQLAQERLEELFSKLTGIRDTFGTNRHYSLSQIRVLEAVVRAVASDDFTLGTQARRWLDDDEFLVRRRIHRDLRKTLAQE